MYKPLIAGVTALSLTLATATPLHADIDREDAGKLLFGLAAIAIIGAALDNRDRREERRNEERAQSPSRLNDPANTWSDLNQQERRRDVRRTLPNACLQTVQTRYGDQRLFGQRCLDRNFRHVNSLPARCAVRVFTFDGPAHGYDPLCLRNEGFRFDRRH